VRLRNVKGARDVMVESEYVYDEIEGLKGRWREIFGNDNPIHIEVGMGKGQFIMALAKKNPDINYVGIEKYSSVLIRAVQKQQEEELPNIHFIRMEAENIADVFEKGEVDKIYLNFSDPWPKDRHANRRLTSARFLDRYSHIIEAGDVVEFKTDNVDLFNFSLETLENKEDWALVSKTYDLHADVVLNEGNIMTEYEQRFSEAGNKICKMIIRYEPVKE